MYGRILAVLIGVGMLVALVVPDNGAADIPVPVRPLPIPPKARPKPLDTVIERAPGGHFETEVLVNGQSVRAIVDTGASTIVLTTADATRAGISFRPDLFTVVGRGASGAVLGQEVVIRQIAVGQRTAFEQRALVVAEGLDVSLLGQSFLAQFGSVTITGDRMTLR
jgi:aspartyl protease family protein